MGAAAAPATTASAGARRRASSRPASPDYLWFEVSEERLSRTYNADVVRRQRRLANHRPGGPPRGPQRLLSPPPALERVWCPTSKVTSLSGSRSAVLDSRVVADPSPSQRAVRPPLTSHFGRNRGAPRRWSSSVGHLWCARRPARSRYWRPTSVVENFIWRLAVRHKQGTGRDMNSGRAS